MTGWNYRDVKNDEIQRLSGQQRDTSKSESGLYDQQKCVFKRGHEHLCACTYVGVQTCLKKECVHLSVYCDDLILHYVQPLQQKKTSLYIKISSCNICTVLCQMQEIEHFR